MTASPLFPSLSANALMNRKLSSMFPLTDEEARAIRELPIQDVELKSGQDIVRLGERPYQCCLILQGFTCVYKLSVGGKRQIMALHVPGDIPDLQSLHLEVMDISIASISSCKVGFFQHEDARRMCELHPRLTAAFWRETLIDASIYREWLLNIGQRDAYARVAHLLCELLIRLKAVGLVEDHTFELPITQEEMADTIGISAVHVSRTFQALRNNGLIETTRTRIHLPDWERLKEAGEFDPLYLHLRGKSA
ncbi:Crp/Fnr family transcriptional regulator [Billgrantia antri]|uniref:Crp/Fnr family transcriptional regulator n=1 Tax=Halomonas sulfidivorans TaxID=2733488 RepID=A0ABX7WK93_9GAMM|nr:Crp/Fnr family transcriptional regulator [Halomonas sulfidivorans]QTP59997.1 Crp/Fnr family transcriptional regulator [Halomonas sulfidivorans]